MPRDVDTRREDEPVTDCDSGRRRLIFGLGATVGAMFAGLVLTGCRDVKKALDVVQKEVTKERFGFYEYTPVSGATVVDSHFESEKAKTVIVFADVHPGYTDDPVLMQRFERYQKCTYDNVADLIRKHGIVDLVQENSTPGFTADALAQVEGDELAQIREIALNPDDLSRIRSARRFVGTSPWNGASACLIASYGSKGINSLPVYTLSELDEVTRIESTARAFSVLAVSPEQLGCGDDSSMNFPQAKAKFEAGDRSDRVVDCFCAPHHAETDALAAFSKNRHIDAPRKEVDAALRSDNNFAVIVAGSLHLREAVRYMREQRVNYIIVSPFEYADETRKNISVQTQIGHTLAPDPDGVCAETRAGYEKMKNEAEERERNEKREAIIDWISEGE